MIVGQHLTVHLPYFNHIKSKHFADKIGHLESVALTKPNETFTDVFQNNHTTY